MFSNDVYFCFPSYSFRILWCLFQPLIKSLSLLATWITLITQSWWLPLWTCTSSPTTCSTSASEWSHCWTSPGKRCWPPLCISLTSWTKEFMVSTILYFWYDLIKHERLITFSPLKTWTNVVSICLDKNVLFPSNDEKRENWGNKENALPIISFIGICQLSFCETK